MPSEQLTNRTLTDEERDKIEGEITLDEMQYALFKKMKGSSAPGIDGFTMNWIRKYCYILKLVTLNAINEYYRTGMEQSLLTLRQASSVC